MNLPNTLALIPMLIMYQNCLTFHTQSLAWSKCDDPNTLSLQRFFTGTGYVGRGIVGIARDEIFARHVDGLVSITYTSLMNGTSTDDIYIQLHCAPIAARPRTRKIINDSGRRIIADTTNGNETESVCNIIVAEDGCVFFHCYCANRHGRDLDLRNKRSNSPPRS